MATAISKLSTDLTGLIHYATDTALDAALGVNIPFAGAILGDIAVKGVPFLDKLQSDLQAKLGGLDDSISASDLATAIDGLEDIAAFASGKIVSIHIGKVDTLNLAAKSFDLSVGSAALGFGVKGGTSLALGYEVDLNLLYHTDTHLLETGTGSDEIKLTLNGNLDVEGSGKLGFLGVKVADGSIDPVTQVNKPELSLSFALSIADNTSVTALGAADVNTVVDGTADLNLKLKTDLPSNLLPELSTNLVVHYDILNFTVGSGQSSLGSTPDISLQHITLNLGSFVGFLAGVFGPIVDTVFGSFPLGPVIDVLTTPLPIIDPALHALGIANHFDQVGKDDVINLLDVAAFAGGDPEILNNFATAFNLIQAIKKATSGSEVLIDFGSVTITGDDPTNGPSPTDALNGTGPAFVYAKPITNPLDAAFAGLQAPNAIQGDSTSTPGLGGTLKPLFEALHAAGVSIPILEHPESVIPLLLNDHSKNSDVDLITYDVPALSFVAHYEQFFPIIGPIGIGVGGSLKAGIDVDFGYDTAGLKLETPDFAAGFYFTTPQTAGGIPKIVDGKSLYFEPAATVGVEIDASAQVNVGFAKLAIGGGVGADLSAYLSGADDPANGKLRLTEITHCVFDPIAGQVNAFLFLDFAIDFGIFSYMHRFDLADITLAEFSFGCDSPSTSEGTRAAFFSDTVVDIMNNSSQQLHLNAGDLASDFEINGQPQKDVGEHFEIRNAHDANGVILNALEVTTHMIKDNFIGGATPISEIVAELGDERDVLVIAKDVTIGSMIHGEDGDDLIVGGAGIDSLYGDDGNDRLIGGDNNDKLYGDDGDDTLEGGLGGDTIDGGDGIDQVSYENSKAGVVFSIKKGTDDVFEGKGGEAAGDSITSIEYLVGSHFDDTLYGNAKESSTIEGLAGNDILIGGSDDDYLIGGGGADALHGGDGEDGTSYLTSASGVVVNLLTGKGSGGDAEGDTYDSIADIQGSSSDDLITGDGGANIIDGWYGDDQLSGGGDGADEIAGGLGNDIVYSSADGNDKLDGGGSRAAPGHDVLSYERSGAEVDVNLYGSTDGDTTDQYISSGEDEIVRALTFSTTNDDGDVTNHYSGHISTFEDLTGSKFNDKLIADDQYNVIKGLAGDDVIDAKGGNDTLIGGAGKDTLNGGTGIDVADYSSSQGGVTVNLANNNDNHSNDAEGDTLSNVENLRGSDHNDTLSGDNNSNELDPGLTRSTISDTVNGGFGLDTLVLDYSRGGNQKGVTGGFDLGSISVGSFTRQENASNTQRDGVTFQAIERLKVTGTAHNDVIFGGTGDDFITTGSGDDLVFTGLGVDRVFAGKGNDIVVSGTDLNRNLSALGGIAPVELVGGAGIDGLSISLAAATESIKISGTDGLSDFAGVNLVMKNGTGVSQFEVLLAVVTGSGDDKITQQGAFNNFFAAGYGVDEIASGLGNDFVDGGLDYRIGTSINAPDANGNIVPIDRVEVLYGNDGDLLTLDYSRLSTAVIGNVANAQTGFTVEVDNVSRALQSNSGHYQSGTNSIDFVNIERLDVTGSTGNDLLVGTNLLFGRNIGADGEIVASQSKRGDDRLAGGVGNDLLIGNTGDDTLLGGNGDDVLLGAAVGSGRGAVVDRGEVDTLTGGDGADTFILGAVLQDLDPVVYYNDGTGATVGPNAVADRTVSGSNRAIITDFQADDFIQLAGVRSDYRSVTIGRSTLIYLRDGQDANGQTVSKNDELIGEIKGITEFDLGAAYVKYVGNSALGSSRFGTSAEISAAPTALETSQAVPPLDSASLAIAERLIASNVPTPIADKALSSITTTQLSTALPSIPQSTAKSIQSSGPQASFVTQNDDPTALRTALFGSGTSLSQGNLTVEGDASAVGIFDGDPFGLGRGVVISTGAVEDLSGPNLVDGGLKIGASTELVFVKIGRVGNNDIFRAELTNIGFDLNSIKLGDQSSGFGGAVGVDSGFDISAVVLSHTRLDSVGLNSKLNDVAVLPRINAFSFDAANAHFAPGTQRTPDGTPGGPDLSGSVNGLPLYQIATLDNFDDGSLTLGDGGVLSFNLNQTVSTKAPLYLYVAENGLSGETLTTGFTASSNRLDTPTDLSTDLGAPGVDGDSTSLTYRFTPSDAKGIPDPSVTQVTFDFVFFSEELVEYAQTQFNDNFKITLNGVNLALLSDGSAASIDTLFAPNASASATNSVFNLREDKVNSDFIYNPVGTGPSAALTRADGYSKVLHFTGNVLPGVENVLRFEVNDVRDGLLDSGILIRGGSFIGATTNDFFVDTITTPVAEGAHKVLNFGLKVPVGNHDANPVSVTFHPTAGIDLGAGAGHDVTRTIDPNGRFTDTITVTPLFDGANDGSRFETVTVELAGRSPLPPVAPLVIEVEDALVAINRTIGDAPVRYNRAAPNAWADAWTANGIHITHTADASGRAPVYSVVDFGTANPKLLSGSDVLNGDLGVSGQVKGTAGGVQDISGKEALRFEFDSDSLSGFSLDFARFERGDNARIELRDAADHVVRTEITSSTTFGLQDLHGIASIIVSAASGAFMIDSLSATEQVDALIGEALLGHRPTAITGLAFAPVEIEHIPMFMTGGGSHHEMQSMHLQIA
jgi:Ca2+-binding RTX toxin-like protein